MPVERTETWMGEDKRNEKMVSRKKGGKGGKGGERTNLKIERRFNLIQRSKLVISSHDITR